MTRVAPLDVYGALINFRDYLGEDAVQCLLCWCAGPACGNAVGMTDVHCYAIPALPCREYFKPLVDSVNNMNVGNDWFLVANDFADYMRAQARR